MNTQSNAALFSGPATLLAEQRYHSVVQPEGYPAVLCVIRNGPPLSIKLPTQCKIELTKWIPNRSLFEGSVSIDHQTPPTTPCRPAQRRALRTV
jgi:hypothetical protein